MSPAATTPASGGRTDVAQRRLPPVGLLVVASMALAIVGGVYLASYLPRQPALGPAVGLLSAGSALLAAGIIAVSRIRPFAWSAFFLVGKWALAAYAVIAGMLEYVFVLDGTRGALLAVLSLMLALFAVDVPLLFAFSVARYQDPTAPRANAR